MNVSSIERYARKTWIDEWRKSKAIINLIKRTKWENEVNGRSKLKSHKKSLINASLKQSTELRTTKKIEWGEI